MKYLFTMIKRRSAGIFIIGILSLINISLYAQNDDQLPDRPVPPHLVNDLADIIPVGEEANLENKLTAYNDSTSTQIVVIILKTIGDFEISDYAYKIGRKWGVGQKDLDNGIVLLVAVDDRKMFIATGYGTESYITDARASRIYREILTPAFQQNNYYGGIDAATTEMIKYLSGAYDGEPMGNSQDKPNIFGLIILIFVILFILSKFFRGGNGGTTFGGHGPTYWGGGGFGGFGGSGGGGGGGGFGGFGGGGFGGGGAGGSW